MRVWPASSAAESAVHPVAGSIDDGRPPCLISAVTTCVSPACAAENICRSNEGGYDDMAQKKERLPAPHFWRVLASKGGSGAWGHSRPPRPFSAMNSRGGSLVPLACLVGGLCITAKELVEHAAGSRGAMDQRSVLLAALHFASARLVDVFSTRW